MPNRLDLTGKHFGRLLVLEIGPKNKWGAYTWKCICPSNNYHDEDKILYVMGNSLISGNTQSCGCINREKLKIAHTKHGNAPRTGTSAEYNAYNAMLQRCYNPNHPEYHNYGIRGIIVCDRWKFGEKGESGFECFLADMGERPSKKHSIERKKNYLGYSPDNCVWDLPPIQNRNKRNNINLNINGESLVLQDAINQKEITYATIRHWRKQGLTDQEIMDLKLAGKTGRKHRYITYNGETKTLAEWAAFVGISRPLLHHRLNKLGWSVERALTSRPSRS